VHGKAANVAARKEQRRDDMRIGGHDQVLADRHRQQCPIIALA